MYGLKYNRIKKKIEITKIIRTPAKAAGFITQRLRQSRRGDGDHQSERDEEDNGMEDAVESEMDSTLARENPPEEDTLYEETAAGDEPTEEPIKDGLPERTVRRSFDADGFIKEVLELMKTHKARLNGIMMNIKNSNIVSEKDKGESHYLIDAFRNIDIDGIQRIDKALNSHKELQNYPRSISYYASKLDTKSKNILESLTSDKSKMEYVFYSEMYYSIWTLYRTLQKILKDLNDFVLEKNPEDKKNVSYNEKQFYNDARTSLANTVEESEDILSRCRLLEDFLGNANNF